MWSSTEQRCIAMGYVSNANGVTADWLESASWEIEVAGERVDASTSLRSFYDPRNERVRM